jgi:hypothetical protein
VEAHAEVFIAAVTVVAVAATIACAVATAGGCLVVVGAAATEGALWGGTGMLVSAAVAAGAETIGVAAAAGAVGVGAVEVAEEAAGDSSSVEGGGAAAADSGAGGGSPGAAESAPEPAAAAPAAPEPAAEPAAPEPAAEPAASPARPSSDGCNSFAAGTTVLMADGSSKPIQDVHVGDQVTNKDPETGQVQTHTVMATHVTDDDSDFVDLTVQTPSGTSTITVTAAHLFWDSTTHSWAEAENLHVGDQLDSHDGVRVTVAASRRYMGSMRTYNLTVDGIHTYWILTGVETVLVHNCGGTYGTALVHLDPNSSPMHASVHIQGAIDGEAFNLHTELAGLRTARIQEYSGRLGKDTMTFEMELSDPEMARDYADIQMRKPNVGRYDLDTNSCVTYVCSVLRAGGWRDAPGTTEEGLTWLWNVNQGEYKTGYGG